MTVEIDEQKWEITKGVFALVCGQQALIGALWSICESHGAILRAIAKAEGVELEDPPSPVDPETLRRMAQGLVELEKLILADEDDARPNA